MSGISKNSEEVAQIPKDLHILPPDHHARGPKLWAKAIAPIEWARLKGR